MDTDPGTRRDSWSKDRLHIVWLLLLQLALLAFVAVRQEQVLNDRPDLAQLKRAYDAANEGSWARCELARRGQLLALESDPNSIEATMWSVKQTSSCDLR